MALVVRRLLPIFALTIFAVPSLASTPTSAGPFAGGASFALVQPMREDASSGVQVLRYDVVDLGTLGGATSHGYDVDNTGHVVGQSETGKGYVGCGRGEESPANHAFLWADGAMTDLGTLGGTNSAAEAINDAGQIVGWAETASGEQHAALWEHGTVVDLGTLGRKAGATAINATGQVVGSSEPYPSEASASLKWPDHAFLWQDGQMTDLTPLAEATAIDDAGRILGVLDGGGAVMLVDGQLADLAPLSQAVGFDAAGRVYGTVQEPEGHSHAAIWDDGVVTDLGALPDRPDSIAADVNAAGQVVGATVVWMACGYSTQAAVWIDGAPIPLQDRAVGAWTGLINATAINDAGQIVATLPSLHAVLLTPRVETATPTSDT